MAISVTQRNIVGNAAASSNPTVAFGSNVTAGNAIIVGVMNDAGINTVGYPTDNLSNFYQFVGTTYAFANSMVIKMFIAYNSPAGACTVTLTTGLNDGGGVIFEAAGLASNNAFDQMAFQAQSSVTSLSSGNTATTRYANELLIGLTINTHATSLVPSAAGSGFSNLQTAGVTFGSIASEEQVISATGVQAATFTAPANSDSWNTAIFTFADTSIRRTYSPTTMRPAPFKPGLAR